MSKSNKNLKNDVSIQRIEKCIRIVAKQMDHNTAYLPLFERLYQERELLLKRQSSLDLAKEWAR